MSDSLEFVRFEEGEEVEEFFEVVLERRAGEEEAVVDGVAGEDGEELRHAVLQAVRLVDHQHRPRDAGEKH